MPICHIDGDLMRLMLPNSETMSSKGSDSICRGNGDLLELMLTSGDDLSWFVELLHTTVMGREGISHDVMTKKRS